MINDFELGRAYRYAYEVTKCTLSYDVERNPDTNFEKTFDRHFTAKVTELHAYYEMCKRGYNCTYPMFEYRDTEAERIKLFTHDSDLMFYHNDRAIHLHVKTCKHNAPVTQSWLIQKSSPLIEKPSDAHYFMFCEYFDIDTVKVVAFMPSTRVNWMQPVKHMPTKMAAYGAELSIN
jgi:hypothetical protein